ncbi:6-O-methylguanine DNA methyltransferase [Umbelopsis sp. AD052]|nr:6-O-methylguanine DNA methyltransferase [Umbelopsis sp. AD052]
MAKAKTLSPTIKKLQPSLHKKAARSRIGKIPDERADVPFDDDIEEQKPFPETAEERAQYISPKTNRKLTTFQFKVLDLCAQIPKGRVTTYKKMADALSSSPRAIGGVMRINPFCPQPVPCHRVVASDGFIGGFNGQWGAGGNMRNKKAKLEKEGCHFNKDGYLVKDESGSWTAFEEFDVSKIGEQLKSETP